MPRPSVHRLRCGLGVLVACLLAGPACTSGRGGSTSPTPTASTIVATSTTTSPGPVAQQATWSLPAPRSREVVLADGSGHLLVAGGLTAARTSTGEVLRVDLATAALGRAGTLAKAVHDAAGAMIGGDVFVFGGGSHGTVDTVQRFGSPTPKVVGQLPRPRSDLVAARVGRTVYLAGGFDGGTMTRSVLTTRDGSRFTSIAELPLGVRYPAIAATARTLYLLGGSDASDVSVDAVQAVELRSGRTSIVAHLDESLAHAAGFVLGGRVFVAGGRARSGQTDVIRELDVTRGRVEQVGRLPYPVSDAGVATVGGRVYLVGGETPRGTVASVIEVELSR